MASRKSPQDSPVQPHTAVILSKCRRAARCASRGPMDIRAAPPCLGSPLSGSSESSLCEATGLATTVAASRVGAVVGRHEAERMRLHEQLELLRDALARWGAVDAERERLQNRNGKSVPKLKQYPVNHRLSTRAILWVPSLGSKRLSVRKSDSRAPPQCTSNIEAACETLAGGEGIHAPAQYKSC